MLSTVFKVTDTPDVRNLDIVKTSAEEEIKQWYAFHPDIILLAIRCDVCYSAEEHQIYQQIKKVLGEKYLTSLLIVAFTFGDRLGVNIDEELKTVCSELKDVLKEAGHRYIVFSNEDPVQDRKTQFMRLRAFAFNEGMSTDLTFKNMIKKCTKVDQILVLLYLVYINMCALNSQCQPNHGYNAVYNHICI